MTPTKKKIKGFARRILITGGAGFIGSALGARLIKDPENYVVLVDNLTTGSLKRLPKLPVPNWKFIRCDVNSFPDIALVMHAQPFDYVFHYAAYVGVKRTQKNPVRVLQDLHGIENILNLSKKTGVKRIYYASSSEVYGEPVTMPQHEFTTPLNSRIPYAVVKNAGESFLRSFNKEYGLEYTIFRFFNTYGPRQDKDFVMTRFIHKALQDDPILIYGDGSQTRTFFYIDDNVEATVNALYQNRIVNDVVNIGGEQEISMLELARMIIRITGSYSHIIHLPPLREGDMNRRCPDTSKMKRQLLRHPATTLEEGIAQIIRDPFFIRQQFVQ